MINCHKCSYYYVTWDKAFPHGCRGMGFKSRQLPSTSVKESSDQECLLFKINERHDQNTENADSESRSSETQGIPSTTKQTR